MSIHMLLLVAVESMSLLTTVQAVSYDLIGCFNGTGAGNSLNGLNGLLSLHGSPIAMMNQWVDQPTSMSLDACARLCRNAGFLFFGAHDGSRCSCGDVFNSSAGLVAAGLHCSTPCAGNAAQFCGGVNYFSVGALEKRDITQYRLLLPQDSVEIQSLTYTYYDDNVGYTFKPTSSALSCLQLCNSGRAGLRLSGSCKAAAFTTTNRMCYLMRLRGYDYLVPPSADRQFWLPIF